MGKAHMPWREKNQAKIIVPKGVENKGIYRNLMNQVNKLARHNRQGSFKTRDRYYQAVERFVRHVADKFRVQKLENISGKHVKDYLEKMQKEGKSASTIKTDLAGIRFWHDKLDKPRYDLPTNDELKAQGVKLERRKFGGVDRTWSKNEFDGLVGKARELGRHNIARILELGRHQGLRIHETIRLDRSTAEIAIRTGELIVKGKGGLVRTVPVSDRGREILTEAIQEINRGEKIFVAPTEKAHEVIKSTQDFIYNHRDKYAEMERESEITYHGARHTFAREEYEKRIAEGKSEEEARQEVAELLGHGRDSVTRIYINK
jgi:integrase